jgi:membrane associated rhomboid family serine protease
MLRAPASVLWLIAVLVAAHLARISLGSFRADMLIDQYAFVPARYLVAAHLFDPSTLWHHLAPFVTYIFLHAGFVHLGLNCLWLLVLGPVVARRFGIFLFVAFFLICGIAGAAAVLALDWGSMVAVIGASGAISGLMGAAIRMMPVNGPFGPMQPTRLAPLFSRQVLMFTATWIAINLVMGLTSFGASLAGGGAIAWQAHVGGYLVGLVLAGLFDRFHPASKVEIFNHG